MTHMQNLAEIVVFPKSKSKDLKTLITDFVFLELLLTG